MRVNRYTNKQNSVVIVWFHVQCSYCMAINFLQAGVLERKAELLSKAGAELSTSAAGAPQTSSSAHKSSVLSSRAAAAVTSGATKKGAAAAGGHLLAVERYEAVHCDLAAQAGGSGGDLEAALLKVCWCPTACVVLPHKFKEHEACAG